MDRGHDNREKLSLAIQNCIAELVDTMPFSDSEIPDILIQDGCITEDECKEMRAKTNRKDQVRKLILLVKGRSFKTMKRLLFIINEHCPSAVKSVWNQYAILLREKREAWRCPMCELKENVDIKYVIDVLYGNKAITTGLFSAVCDSNSSIGQQDYFWNSLFKGCSGDNLKYLIDALKAKGHYNHIAESLNYYRQSLSHDPPCLCSSVGTPPVPRKATSDETESSTTQSPLSTSFGSTYEGEITTPKTLFTGQNSDQQSNVSSEVTVIANTRDEDHLLPDIAENDQSSDTTLYRCICLCCKCCRVGSSIRNNFGGHIN